MEIEGFCLGAFRTNCYLVKNRGEAFLVDPGDSAEGLIGYLKQNEVELKAIMITHGHIDHLGAAAKTAEAFSAPILFPEKEMAYLDNRTYPLMIQTAAQLESFRDYLRQSGRSRLLSDGDMLDLCGLEVRCIEVPGHTDHSMVYYIPSEAVLFSGDTLFERSVGRTDMYSGAQEDLTRHIRERLLTLPGDTYVLPGHGGATTIGREALRNPYLRENL